MGASTAEVLVGHRAAGGVKVDGTRVIGVQASQINEAAVTGGANAAATAIPVAVTGVTVDVSAMEDGSSDNVLETVTATNATAAEAPIERNFDKCADEIEANRADMITQKAKLDLLITDLGLMLVQADKSTVDLAAQKAVLDKLIVRAEGHGLTAS